MSGTKMLKYLQQCRFHSKTSTTIDKSEMLHFQKYVDLWWNEFGELKALHSMNKIRVPWIRDSLISNNEIRNSALPLAGHSIIDVGCGGGILSEPLAKIGANVTGLDANKDLIKSAKTHADLNNIKINYVVSSIEEHAKENAGVYDGLVASEVIEHVTEKELFIEACVKCLKPGGSIFFTTFNKTYLAYLLGIFAAENFFNLIPKGTHQYEKFIAPHDLQRILEDNNCRTEIVHGLIFNVFTNTWYWCADPSVSYGLRARKLSK